MNVWGFGRINDLAYEIHQLAREKGFWDHRRIDSYATESVENPSIFGEKLMLVVTEVSEIMEARRDGDEELEKEETADAVIRLLDYAEARGFNIEQAIVNKIEKNRTREHRHGKGLG